MDPTDHNPHKKLALPTTNPLIQNPEINELSQIEYLRHIVDNQTEDEI